MSAASSSESIHARAKLILPRRDDAAVASIARAWRELTSGHSRQQGRRLGPGEMTVVACSGGADSSALAIALAAVTGEIVLAHVVHDMRPREQALADRDGVSELARLLGRRFIEAEISARSGPAADVGATEGRTRNVEHVARARRYDALARLAREVGARYVATAHHSQDQLETLLMRLLRGTGPRGLRGIARRRALTSQSTMTIPVDTDGPAGATARAPADQTPWLIRPMLDASRADAERICREAGWRWLEDGTNLDTARLRSALRVDVIPALLAVCPEAGRHVSHTADMLRELVAFGEHAARGVDARARVDRDHLTRAGERGEAPDETEPTICWDREPLRQAPHAVLGLVLRRAIDDARGGRWRDRVGFDVLRRISGAIVSESRDPRRFVLRGVEIEVTSRFVLLRRTHP